jgi:hypothetical protein
VVRRLAHRLALTLAAVATAAVADLTLASTAEAKAAPRALLVEHHAQSRLGRVTKVRRVQRPRVRKIAIIGFARTKRAPVVVAPDLDAFDFDIFDQLEAEAETPVLEELEIEAVLPDFSIDDPSKRILAPEVKVREAPAPPMPEPVPPATPPPETQRPRVAKRLIRMHPKLLDSGDDAPALS